MGYAIFEKTYPSKSLSPTITISPLGRCTLNRAAAEILSRDAVDHFLIMWDAEAKKFAIRPIGKKDPNRSFQLRYSKKRNDEKVTVGAAFSGVMFLKHVGYDYSTTAIYPFTKSADGSLYEVQLPAERFGVPQQPLVAVEGGRKRGKVAS